MRVVVNCVLLIVLIVNINYSCSAQQASSAAANASTSIIAPISLSKSSDMDFGSLNIATGGKVTISSKGRTTSKGGVNSSKGSAASFSLNSQGGYSYSLSFPDSLIITNGTDSITISNFTSSTSTDGTGNQKVSVGGTLDVGSAKTKGVDSVSAILPIGLNIN